MSLGLKSSASKECFQHTKPGTAAHPEEYGHWPVIHHQWSLQGFLPE
jgi:hypothetical protein